MYSLVFHLFFICFYVLNVSSYPEIFLTLVFRTCLTNAFKWLCFKMDFFFHDSCSSLSSLERDFQNHLSIILTLEMLRPNGPLMFLWVFLALWTSLNSYNRSSRHCFIIIFHGLWLKLFLCKQPFETKAANRLEIHKR